MSKAAKRLKRNLERAKGGAQVKDRRTLERDFDRAYEQGAYADALDILAKLVGCVDAGDAESMKPSFLYKGAMCYYELSDYDRAAQWVTNTLTYAPAHVDARLLLAKICLLKNRLDDGMAILNLLLQNGLASLTEAQQAAAKKIWLRYGEGSFAEKFPNLAALAAGEKPPVTGKAEKQAAEVKDLLRRLKEKVASAKEKAAGGEAAAAPSTPAAPAQKPVPATAPQPIAAQQAEASVATATSEGQRVDAETTIASVRDSKGSVADKVRILNSFAGASYLALDYAAAKTLLLEALRYDSGDEQTLRNLVYTLVALDEREQAEKAVAAMPVTDFALLHLVQKGR